MLANAEWPKCHVEPIFYVNIALKIRQITDFMISLVQKVIVLGIFGEFFMIRSGFLALSASVLTLSVSAMADDGSLQKPRTSLVNLPTQMLSNYDVETTIPVLQEMGISWEGRTAPSGAKVLLATAENGIKFVLAPTACNAAVDDGCAGINMIAVFDGKADQRTVESFNYRYPYTSVGIDNNGSAFISRYDIADFGVPKGNFASSLDVFVSQAAYFKDSLENQTVTVNRASYSGDFASNALNIGQTLEDKAAANRMGLDVASHSVSLEQTADFVSVLFEASEQAPDKILNDIAK